MRSGPPPPLRGLTILELIVVAAIVLLLAGIATINYQEARTRSRVSASKANLRLVADALDLYRIDHNRYPQPIAHFPADPFGIVAKSALRGLTTPIAYVGPGAFEDPFGLLRIQPLGMFGGGVSPSSLGPPAPRFNADKSLLYFHYPHFARMVGGGAMATDGYSVVSIGPDEQDSFVVYYPFPDELPERAADFGIVQVSDTVYDPTNGAFSGGDLAAFGGAVPAARLVGGAGD